MNKLMDNILFQREGIIINNAYTQKWISVSYIRFYCVKNIVSSLNWWLKALNKKIED